MKTFKVSLFCLLALLCLSTTVHAQWSAGIRGGVLGSNIRGKGSVDELFSPLNDLRSTQLGVNLAYEISPHLVLQSDLGWSRRGFGYRQGTDLDIFNLQLPLGVVAEARIHYADLAMLLRAQTGGRKIKAYVTAGPSIAYALDGKIKTRTDGLLDINLFSTPLDLDAIGIRRLEVGGMAGAGLAMTTGFGEIFAEARYYRAFSSLFDLPVLEGNVFNQSLGLNLGINIPLGGKMPLRP